MKILVTADLHLTDRLDDEYRWGLFDWLTKQAKKHKAEHLFILGDLADSKDRHSAVLTNRTAKALGDAARAIAGKRLNMDVVHVLMGNHDFIDSKNPFFEFLSYVPNVRFYREPEIVEIADGTRMIGMLPFYRDGADFYKAVKRLADYVDNELDLLFMHQTLKGSLLSNGYKIDAGLDVDNKILNKIRCPVFSGDVHVPQKIGKVEYVGSPYQIKFGDDFTPRVLLLDTKKPISLVELNYPCLKKWTFDVNSAKELAALCKEKVAQGDRVKVRLQINKRDIPEGGLIRRDVFDTINKHSCEVESVALRVAAGQGKLKEKTSESKVTTLNQIDLLTRFCEEKEVPKNLMKVGLGLLRSG